jgi:hypothetical protein
MFQILSVFVLLFSISAQADGVSRHEGFFVSPTKTFYYVEDPEDCRADGGTYEDGMCVIDIDDTVTIVAIDKKTFDVSVTTWGSNTHSCNFEEKGKLVSKNEILAIGVFDNGEDGTEKCRLRIRYKNNNQISVRATDRACRYYCGARAWGLGIKKATRKN